MSSSIRTVLRKVLCGTMTSKQNQPYTVFVEGNIGCGKTTLLNHFKLLNNVSVIPEPVTQWQNARGHNLLDLFYKDPKHNGMAFQSYVQLTMVNAQLSHVHKPVKMLERSLYSARYCFVENLSSQGIISQSDFCVLDDWFRWITSNLSVAGNLIIYLRSSPEVVYERIKQRGRNEEANISMEYLQSLHDLHDDWLIHGTKFKAHIPVVVIDADKHLNRMKSEYLTCEDRIMEDAGVRNAFAESL